MITAASVSHRRADVATIEAVSADAPGEALDSLLAHDEVTAALVLQTCNRAERYVVAPSAEAGRARLDEWLAHIPSGSVEVFDHDGAIEHLFRVAAGVESMIVDDDEVLGQLGRARELADERNALDRLLGEVTEKALQVGKRVRTETSINEGTRSISRAAVEMAADRVDLESADVAVLGAGEMGERIAHACHDHDVARLVILNRSPDRARALAADLPRPARARGIDGLAGTFRDVDVAITATASPSPLVTREDVDDAEPLFFVDVAQPRDVAPGVGTVAGIDRVDIDDLEAVTESTSTARAAALEDAEAIIEAERERLNAQLKRRQADHVIATMYEQAERIKDRELAEASAKLAEERDIDPAELAVLEDLADALVGQLMAAPTKSLREAAENDDWDTIQTALSLFDPEFPTGEVQAEEGAMPPTDVMRSDGESS